jgi:glycine cleavage system aminomethyltransferase T
MLDVGIGLGYVPEATATPNTKLVIDVHGKPRHAEVKRKPLYAKEA